MGRITISKAKKTEAHKDYWVVRNGGKAVKNGYHLMKSNAKHQAEAIRRLKEKKKMKKK